MKISILASSSSGNCTLVSHKSRHLLIDAGISMKRISEGLRQHCVSVSELEGIIITHEHTDHICGLKMLLKHERIPVYASGGTSAELCRAMPEAEDYISRFTPGHTFELAGIEIKSFKTPHDASESVGYTLSAGAAKLAYVTDLGRVTDECLSAALGAQTAVIEANYDANMLRNGAYPVYIKKRISSDRGHLSNTDSAVFACRLAESGVRRIILAHLSRENNDPRIARETVYNALNEAGADPGGALTLTAAAALNLSSDYITV